MNDDFTPGAILGLILGAATTLLIVTLTDFSPTHRYSRGVEDALNGNLHKVLIIENGDTTITYRYHDK